MPNKKTYRSIAQNLPLLTQLGLNLILPLVLCLWGGSYLQRRFELGTWVVGVALVLGLFGSFSGLVTFARYAQKQADAGAREHREED